MMVTVSPLSPTLPAKSFGSDFRPQSQTSGHVPNKVLSLTSTATSSSFSLRRSSVDFHRQSENSRRKCTEIWRISATSGEISPTDATALDASQGMSATGDDGASIVIEVLLFVAFVALSVLTLGVVYIGVTDFLGKREREKFEKEEAAKRPRGGKRRKARAKAGPRGFGQKIDDDDVLD